MNRVQDTEKFHYKPSVSIFQVNAIQGHKANLKRFGLGGVIDF